MLNKSTLTKFIGTDFYGVEVVFSEGGQQYFVAKCAKKKGSLSVVDNFILSSIEEVKEKLSNTIPLVMCFTGDGIISKKVKKEQNYKSKVLFNSKLEDFHWFEYHYEADIFLSIARRPLIDEVLSEFKELGFFVIQVNLGAFVVSIFQQIASFTKIITNNVSLIYQNQKIVDFEEEVLAEATTINLGAQEISSQFSLAFAGVINYLLPVKNIENEVIDLLEEESFLYKNAIKKIGIPFVIGLFSLLIISYFITDSYTKKSNQLSFENDSWKYSYEKVTALKRDKHRKEAIFKKSGITNNKFISDYVWSMIKEMPKEIQLQELHVFPLTKKIEKRKKVNFDNNLIEIKGVVSQNVYLSHWIKAIKKNKWIANIEIVEFKKEKKNNFFKIKVKLQYD